MSTVIEWWNSQENYLQLLLYKNWKLHLELKRKRRIKPDHEKPLEDLWQFYFSNYEINLDSLTPEQIREITKTPILNFSNEQINNLNFLYSFKNVRELYLNDCDLVEIDAIRYFSNLKVLSLEETFCKVWPNNVALQNLRKVNLSLSNVSDLSIISKCPNLEELYFDQTEVSHLMNCEGFNKLKKIGFNATPIKDLRYLESASKLEEIYFISSDVEDLYPLGNLRNLKFINLSDTKVISLESLYGLRKLTLVLCYNTDIPESQFDKIRTFSYKCEINPDLEKRRMRYKKISQGMASEFHERLRKEQEDDLEQLRKELYES